MKRIYIFLEYISPADHDTGVRFGQKVTAWSLILKKSPNVAFSKIYLTNWRNFTIVFKKIVLRLILFDVDQSR